MSSFYIWWGWVEIEDQCCRRSIFEEKRRLVLSRIFVKYELWILIMEVMSVWFMWVGVASVEVQVGWLCSHRVGSPLEVWTKAIAVLRLCCVLSLRPVICLCALCQSESEQGGRVDVWVLYLSLFLVTIFHVFIVLKYILVIWYMHFLLLVINVPSIIFWYETKNVGLTWF
jgi:hypothetical protein